MKRSYGFLTLLGVVAVSIVFGMIVGGKLNAPRVVLAAPERPAGRTAAGPAVALAPALAGSRGDFADIVEAVSPAVVGVTNSLSRGEGGDDSSMPEDLFHRWFFRQEPREGPDQQRRRAISGSGFLVSADGYILSNNHVAANSDRLVVEMQDGQRYDAKLIGADPAIDLALLKIESKDGPLPYLELGDSDAARIGSWVIAIGNPLEFTHSVTAGIISGKSRHVYLPDADFDPAVAVFLQTDAAINLGNSGGPLIDVDGHVVGINTAINRGNYAEGIGFALQINEARAAMEQLRTSGEVRRGLLGVTMNANPIDEEAQAYYGLPDRRGVIIQDVTSGGPADKAGIRPDDVVRKVDGKAVFSNDDLLSAIASHRPGDKVELEVFRKGKTFTTTATLAERDIAQLTGQSRGDQDRDRTPPREGTVETTDLGVTVETFDPNAPRFRGMGLDTSVEGVLVTRVQFGSQADDKGVTENTVITHVDDQRVRNLGDWKKAMASLKPGKTVKLEWTDPRGRSGAFVFLTVPK